MKHAKIKPWDSEKAVDFQSNIDEENLQTFERKLQNCQNEIENMEKESIDSLVNELGNIFIDSATKTFGTFKSKNTINIKKKVIIKTIKSPGLIKTVKLRDRNIVK